MPKSFEEEIFDDEDHLGVLLYRQWASLAWPVVSLFFSLPFWLMETVLFKEFGRIPPPLWLLGLGLIPLLLTGYGILGIRRHHRYRLDLHEAGVRERYGRSSTIILYGDFEAVSYARIKRETHPFSYNDAGSEETLILKRGGPRKQSFTMKRRLKDKLGRQSTLHETTPLEAISQHAGAAIGARMSERVERGEEVVWTKRVRLHRDWIEYGWPGTDLLAFNSASFARYRDRIVSWLRTGKRPWIRLKWNEIDDVMTIDSNFQLWADKHLLPCLTIRTSAPNFEAGHRLFEHYRGLHQSETKALKPAASGKKPEVGGWTLRWSYSVDDQIALRRYLFRSTAIGRKIHSVRVAVKVLPWSVVAIVLLISFYQKNWMDRSTFFLIFGSIVVGSVVLAKVMSPLMFRKDARDLREKFRIARETGLAESAESHYGEIQASIGPSGFISSTKSGEARAGWNDIEAVDHQPDGTIFLQYYSEGLKHKINVISIPTHAWPEGTDTEAAFETMRIWRTEARGEV